MKKILSVACLLIAACAQAQIHELDETDLSEVSGRDGLAIKAHMVFGGVSTGSGVNEVKTNSIYLGFGEYAGTPAYIGLEHLNGYVHFVTPLLIDVVDNGAGLPVAVQFTMPGSIQMELGIDSISAQSGLIIEKEMVNVVDHTSGVVLRQEVVNKHDLGGISLNGRMEFTPGSFVQIFGHK
jgi:hypothetical protein